MRNFIRFISQFANLIFFVVLEVLCAVLISRTRTIQGNDLVNSSNAVSGFFYKRQNAIVHYFGLGRMNDSLLAENRKLHEALANLQFATTNFSDSIAHLPTGLPDSSHRVTYARYIFRTAKVINNSVAQQDNYITLNRGADEGIRKGMPVISSSGAVGKVVHVSPHFSTVLSLLSSLQEVSVHLKDGTVGIAKWQIEGTQPSPDVLYMTDVPAQIPMRIGDSVWTTTYSFFPPEVLVGIIQKVLIVKKTGKRLLYLKPANNFRNMQYVYVAENTYNEEQRQLELENKTEQNKPKKRMK